MSMLGVGKMTLDIECGVSELERDVLAAVHDFARDVMRPAGTELDKLADPSDVIAADSVLWKVHSRYRELDIDAIAADDTIEPIRKARLRAMIGEELGWGDSGLSISLGVAGFHRLFAELSGNQQLVDRYSGDHATEIGCWAITEPDHGSDQLSFDDPFFTDPSVKANCRAYLDGDEWVINGQKSAWVSNGTIAEVATLFCNIDQSMGMSGGGVCIVPLDGPGVSRGKPLDKLGQRPLNQGEIFFDDVHIPKANMLVGTDTYLFALEQVLALANMSMGSTFVGAAQAAYEHALDYAKNRVQGGKAIISHQGVRLRLFRMFSKVEAARSLSRRVAMYNGTEMPRVEYSIASKTFCTQAAFEVASDAVQIFGGNGLARDYPVEKLLRDTRASMIEDGCNDVLSMEGAFKL